MAGRNRLHSSHPLPLQLNDTGLIRVCTMLCSCAPRNLHRTTGGKGQVTTYTYNAGNRLLTLTEPDGTTTTNSYDNNGNLAGANAAGRGGDNADR